MAVTFDTAPAFGAPSVTPGIDVPNFNHRRPGVSYVTLKSGVRLPLPVRIWNTRALVLNGLADGKALDAALSKWLGRRVETVRVNRDFFPEDKSSQSLVAIWAPDYEGCSIGPIKVVCLAGWIRPFDPKNWETYRFTWWHYYGNSPTNHEFKAQVWGIENELAAVETSYTDTAWKSARYLQNGQPALTMAWNVGRVHDYVEGPQAGFDAAKFISVSQREDTKDKGENELWLRIRRLKNPNAVDDRRFPFDPHRDIYRCDPNTKLGRALGEVGFLPVAWEFLTNYSGVVWITQPDGRGTAPPWPDRAPAEPKKSRRARRYKVKR